MVSFLAFHMQSQFGWWNQKVTFEYYNVFLSSPTYIIMIRPDYM